MSTHISQQLFALATSVEPCLLSPLERESAPELMAHVLLPEFCNLENIYQKRYHAQSLQTLEPALMIATQILEGQSLEASESLEGWTLGSFQAVHELNAV